MKERQEETRRLITQGRIVSAIARHYDLEYGVFIGEFHSRRVLRIMRSLWYRVGNRAVRLVLPDWIAHKTQAGTKPIRRLIQQVECWRVGQTTELIQWAGLTKFVPRYVVFGDMTDSRWMPAMRQLMPLLSGNLVFLLCDSLCFVDAMRREVELLVGTNLREQTMLGVTLLEMR